MVDPAAIYPFGISAISAIATAVAHDANPAQWVVSGVLGNAAFVSILRGLQDSKHAWGCFRENCRRPDPRKNHILFHALMSAHWKAAAQALAEYARAQALAEYARAQGLTSAAIADAMPLPQALRDAVAASLNALKPMSLNQQADFDLRPLILTID